MALAHFSIENIISNSEKFKTAIQERKEIFNKFCEIKREGLIYPIPMKSPQSSLEIRDKLLENSFLVGAIRPPTVEKAILRVILRANINLKTLQNFLNLLAKYKY
jgi:8-amino-7-oxononanoate synthase